MKFINISLLSILISIFITGCLSGGAMKSAENLVAAKDYSGAIETYQSIVDSKPNTAEARAAKLAIGRIYIKHLQKLDEGIKVYETVIADAPESEEAAHAHYQLGMYFYNQKDYQAAQTRFNTIINKFSELELRQNAQLMLAKSYEDGQEYGQAVETFDKFVKDFPENKRAVQALTQKARIQREFLNDEDGAILTFQSIVRQYSEAVSAKSLVEKVRIELIGLGHSPFGFGPYPEVPAGYPYLGALWDNDTPESELVVRVRIKLWEQGTKTLGAAYDPDTGLVFPTISGVIYIKWRESKSSSPDTDSQLYAGLTMGDGEAIEKYRSIFLTEYGHIRTDVQQDPKDFGITIYEYPDGGIDPYEFLGLKKKDKTLDTLLE